MKNETSEVIDAALILFTRVNRINQLLPSLFQSANAITYLILQFAQSLPVEYQQELGRVFQKHAEYFEELNDVFKLFDTDLIQLEKALAEDNNENERTV